MVRRISPSIFRSWIRRLRSQRSPKAWWGIAAASLGALFIVAVVYHVVVLWGTLDEPVTEDGAPRAARVYSGLGWLHAGQRLQPQHLEARLLRLRYQRIRGQPQEAGQFSRSGKTLVVALRPLDTPIRRRDAATVRFAFDDERLTEIEALANGMQLEKVALEPELLARAFGEDHQVQHYRRLAEIPDTLVRAVLAAEDADFFDHGGFDWRGILRALWANLRRGAVHQGGSTITQQLAKTLFLGPERTLWRKAKEAVIALLMEIRWSKERILETYLNEIYLGQKGSVSVIGVGEASLFYFGKGIDRLTVDEAALIAGLIKAPSSYSPHRHPERAKTRRDAVLRSMEQLGWIEKREYESAIAAPITPSPYSPYKRIAPYFFDHIAQTLNGIVPEGALQNDGLSIYTTLDPMVQRAAEGALQAGLRRLENQHPRLRRPAGEPPLQGAVLVMNAQSGAIIAMVGGRDYGQSQFNRATQAKRQPGSAFKPVVYAAALQSHSPISLLSNHAAAYKVHGQPWAPRNPDGQNSGFVTTREALVRSLNMPAVDIAMRTGLRTVIATARSLGFSSRLASEPSLALGAFEVTPLELTRAFAAFAATGHLPEPRAAWAITDADAHMIHGWQIQRVRAIPQPVAYVLTSMLEDVVDHGTGAAIRSFAVEGPLAGKTGTTNKGRDAWFVGYTPDFVALVWVGFDDSTPIRSSGSQAALPIWAGLVQRAPWLLTGRPFPMPHGVVLAKACPESKMLASPGCPDPIEEVFVPGTEPTESCPEHANSLGGAFDRFKKAIGF